MVCRPKILHILIFITQGQFNLDSSVCLVLHTARRIRAQPAAMRGEMAPWKVHVSAPPIEPDEKRTQSTICPAASWIFRCFGVFFPRSGTHSHALAAPKSSSSQRSDCPQQYSDSPFTPTDFDAILFHLFIFWFVFTVLCIVQASLNWECLSFCAVVVCAKTCRTSLTYIDWMEMQCTCDKEAQAKGTGRASK